VQSLLLVETRVRRTVIVWSLLVVSGMTAVAQSTSPRTIYRASWADVAAVSATGVVALLPGVLGLPKGPPSCAPCDPSGLPGIDRWVVGRNSALDRNGSTVLLLGVGGVATYWSAHDQSSAEARGNLAVLANAISWTSASTQWLKVLVRRKRPVLYTSGAVAAATAADNQRSFPSGHTSVAFAVATSYLVMANREHLPHRTRNAMLLYGGATGVGVLRMTAGSHFTTDVLAGAALGAGIGWLVATVHPRLP
jgi:membrane-associated phospholipid phosphatase